MSNLLRLRQILSSPSRLDMKRQWVSLGEGDGKAILIYGDELSNLALNSESIIPPNLVEYYYGILNLSQGSLPNIENLFSHAPLFLSGETHKEFRMIFAKKYKEIERDLAHWLPELTNEILMNAAIGPYSQPIKIVSHYLQKIFREIAARDLGIQESEIPSFPEKFFTLYPGKNKLIRIENGLSQLRHFFETRLKELNRNPIEAQILMSIYVVGGEPLESALLYGLLKPPPNHLHWDAKELFRAAAAVNFFGRNAKKDLVLGDLALKKNQEIFICPSLIHIYIDQEKRNSDSSFSFGKGPHNCLGKNIATEIATCFFSTLYNHHIELGSNADSVKFVRDNINLQVQIG